MKKATRIGSILPSVVGDLVNLPGERKAYAVQNCELAPGPTTAFACLTCRQLLANQEQLQMHIEADQRAHVVARRCPEHGWETAGESR